MAIGIQDQYFGTEIEMTGITRQRAAEAVSYTHLDVYKRQATSSFR